jgi:hypothetical protein
MIIGQPQSIEEFAPLTPQEFAQLRAQIEPALKQGAPLDMPVGLDLGTVLRLVSTISHFAATVAQMHQPKPAPVDEAAAPELPPLPVFRRDE